MESYEKKIQEHRFLEKFNIEKSIVGTEAFYMDQDLQKGEDTRLINEKLRNGVYSNGNILKSEADDLIKAISADSLIGGISDFKITKKGSEIKAAIKSQQSNIEAKKVGLLSDMSVLKKQIGVEPTQDFCNNHSYMTEDLDLTNVDLPKEYGYSNEKVEDGNSSMPIYNSVDNDVNKSLKSQYDSKLYSYVDMLREERKMNTVINNIDDKKSYNLNARLASKLGF